MQFVMTFPVFAAIGVSPAFAQSATTAANSPAPATTASATMTSGELPSQQVVVNGIKRGDLILPTTVTSSSAFGVELDVLDTPRNNTILSSAQLDALNVKDPHGFSYLTSSSYSDSSFGVPNVPRIRGQFADVFVNGMRDSFTANGYGAPFSFNAIDTIDINKGPATVQAGPGAGVGGSINISTKQPNFVKFTGVAGMEFDTIGHRRLSLDAGGPLNDDIAWRFSYSGDNSGSYWYDQYFHQQSVYGVVTDRISPKYSVTLSSEVSEAKFTENDGVNRVNQAFINHGSYLTGGIVGNWQSFGTETDLGDPVQLGRRANIDESPGTGARSLKYNVQLIQEFDVNDNVSISNNTFFNYLNRYNLLEDYFADSTKNSYTVENKTDFKLSFGAPVAGQTTPSQSIDAGFTFRFAHVEDIENFLNETVSVFDLSSAPSSWVYPNAIQTGLPYTGAFNKPLYGIPGRDAFAANASIDSDLSDVGLFLEHRIAVLPKLNILYGVRADFVHLNEKDPLGIAGLADPVVTQDASHSTKWYMLGNANVSGVYKPAPWASTYLTYNYAQYVDPTSDDGGVGTFGVSDSSQLRQTTKLVELGAKFDLLQKSLFLSTAVFKQSRSIPTGAGGTSSSTAHISGAEAELNYQPNPRFFMTASYSFLRTILDSAAPFYDYPAQEGKNIDGAATEIVWAPGQKFKDPGVPQNLFNVLVNYKFESGLGVQANLQVTSPIETTTSGQIDLTNTPDVPASIVANGGYYKSPVIPRQYTLNSAVFYDFRQFEVKASVYNVTNRRTLTNDAPFYGNDFITVNPPRSLEISLKAKF
jgi:outer membrane receptor protein involved in Fe transport